MIEKEIIVRQGFGYKDLPKLEFSQEEMEELNKITNDQKIKKFLVKEVMLGWDLCRNNDRILDFECLRTEFEDIQITSGKNNIVIKIPRDLMLRLPSPETYTRARRNLILSAFRKKDPILKDLIPTNENVLKHRILREKGLREYFREEKLIRWIKN